MSEKQFKLTQSQERAAELMSHPGIHNVLLYGGSRSGKSFYILRAMLIRASIYAGSRQVILRRTFSDCRTSIGMDTLPKVLQLCFPGIPYHLDKTDWYFKFGNGSEIWLGGLDDKERVDKILGKEYISIYFNEASQISYPSVTTAMSRLAQLSMNANNVPAINKAYYDCNPPTKSHWLYTLFVKKIEPTENIPLADPDDYAMLQMNPDGNKENINQEYLEKTLANLPYRQRQRFLAGEFMEDLDSGLWKREMINPYRIQAKDLPQLVRVVVGVDPAVTANERSDATGIVVVGMDINGELYVLDDATLKASPAVWAKAVCDMYYQHDADRIVGEVNNGGDLVEMNLRNIDRSVSYKSVHASKGKIVRAEPVAHLYERGLVHHVGIFPELEDEMCEYNPLDSKASPNRLDACLVGETMVTVDSGLKKIRDIKINDMVLTRNGFQRVIESQKTQTNASISMVILSNGRYIMGTENHPVFVQNGWVKIGDLKKGDIVWQQEKSLSLMGNHSRDTLTVIELSAGITTAILANLVKICINEFGNIIMAKYRTGMLFITLTAIRLIIQSKICNVLRWQTITNYISLVSVLKEKEIILIQSDRLQKNGTQVRLEENGISGMELNHGKTESQNLIKLACFAAKSFCHILKKPITALKNVFRRKLQNQKNITSRQNAQFVEQNSCRINIAEYPIHAAVLVEDVILLKAKQDVYNLEVENKHEYFANGILVHNCVWAITELGIKKSKACIWQAAG